MLRRGLLRRCPVCGEGRIFRTLLRLRRECPACGWILERDPGAVTGPMYLVSVLTLPFGALVALALWLLTDWPPAVQVAAGLPVIVLFSANALWVAKGAWAAIDYLTDVRSGDAALPEYEAKAFRR